MFSRPKGGGGCNCEVTDVLINLIAIIISQRKHISNHHAAHLKYNFVSQLYLKKAGGSSNFLCNDAHENI